MMKIEQDPGCIFFQFSNVIFVEQVEAALQAILDIKREQGITRVLCDVSNQADTLGMVDLYQLGLELRGKEFEDISIAVFSKKISPGIEFISKVINPSQGRIHKFDSEQAAREWLFNPLSIKSS
jgi:hypothetical protein